MWATFTHVAGGKGSRPFCSTQPSRIKITGKNHSRFICHDGERPEDQKEPRTAAKRAMEDELRDPKNAFEYFLPRPLRLALFGGSAVSCLVATLINMSAISSRTASLSDDGVLINLSINTIGLVAFVALFLREQQAAETRVTQRLALRQAQTKFGDREVFVNEQGEKMSRLKDVDDDWIVRRLERWGKNDGMPFLGPKKAAILQDLILKNKPRLILEVGSMCGYSTIKMAQVLPDGGRIVGIEKDWKWVLAAKRFVWQSAQGVSNDALRESGLTPVGDRVDIKWGDALQVLPKLPPSLGIEMLFLDGTPKETLAYLQAAEPLLADGAIIVADNAGVFKDGGMKPYLEYVRNSQIYSSEYVPSIMGWREDVEDGLEVSKYSSSGTPVIPDTDAS